MPPHIIAPTIAAAPFALSGDERSAAALVVAVVGLFAFRWYQSRYIQAHHGKR